MMFAVEEVFQYLTSKGEVYTLRTTRRRRVGREGLRRTRTGPCFASGIVKLAGVLRSFNDPRLRRWVRHSGFPTVKDWRAAYIRANHGKEHAPIHAYHVKIVELYPSGEGT